MRQLGPRLRQLVVGLAAGGLFALAPLASAQSPTDSDTLDWKRYYPLEVGNVWEYHDAEIPDRITRHTLVADTVAEGRTYYRRQLDHALIHYGASGLDTTRYTNVDYVRYDAGGVVTVLSVEADTITLNPCADDGFERDLRLAFGIASPCPLPHLYPEADSVHVEGTYATMWSPSAIGRGPAGDPVEVATIKHTTVGVIFSAFVADIGPVSTGNMWGPRLHYARIGGVEYGAPSALVNAEATPRQLETISIRVLQNPVRDQARFAVTLPPARRARWTVTDALGRIVLASDLDPASSTVVVPTHGLATGTYRFTVSAADARGIASFTVVR